jgi:hypothetical protein
MKYFILVLVIFFAVDQLDAQNLIGLKKDKVYEVLKKFYPDFAIENNTNNKTYKYIKCTDVLNDQTLLIFLSDKDVSTSTKLMSSYSNLEEVKKKFSKNYISSGKDSWKYTVNGIVYVVKLKREEWFFTVFTSQKEK